MSEEALEAKFGMIIEELRKFQCESRETHKGLYDRVNALEKRQARLEVIAGGGLFAAGILFGVLAPKLFI